MEGRRMQNISCCVCDRVLDPVTDHCIKCLVGVKTTTTTTTNHAVIGKDLCLSCVKVMGFAITGDVAPVCVECGRGDGNPTAVSFYDAKSNITYCPLLCIGGACIQAQAAQYSARGVTQGVAPFLQPRVVEKGVVQQ